VRTLWLFGSATSDRFDPQRSDADFLVEFNGPDLEPWMKRYFELRRALEAILGRPYDLVPHDAVKGSYFRISPDTSRVPLYVAA
jgi:predicted nucleotidyltransferase